MNQYGWGEWDSSVRACPASVIGRAEIHHGGTEEERDRQECLFHFELNKRNRPSR